MHAAAAEPVHRGEHQRRRRMTPLAGRARVPASHPRQQHMLGRGEVLERPERPVLVEHTQSERQLTPQPPQQGRDPRITLLRIEQPPRVRDRIAPVIMW